MLGLSLDRLHKSESNLYCNNTKGDVEEENLVWDIYTPGLYDSKLALRKLGYDLFTYQV